MKEMICIHQGPWICVKGRSLGEHFNNGPKYLEMCLVSDNTKYPYCYVVSGYESITGGPCYFNKKWFVDALDISELTEILEQKPEHS